VSIEELANTTPVTPPTVKRKMNPNDHKMPGVEEARDPYIVANHLKILMPVGMAIIIVADVK
jgi:hypothetical protein